MYAFIFIVRTFKPSLNWCCLQSYFSLSFSNGIIFNCLLQIDTFPSPKLDNSSLYIHFHVPAEPTFQQLLIGYWQEAFNNEVWLCSYVSRNFSFLWCLRAFQTHSWREACFPISSTKAITTGHSGHVTYHYRT